MDASQDVLIEIFVRIESFFKRLESYTEVRPTEAMTDVIVKIMIQVLSILAISTKQIKQGRSSELFDIHKLVFAYLFFIEKYLKKLLGKNDIEDVLKKLDTLTTEEARMATAETLKVTNRVDIKVDNVDNKVEKVDDKVDKVDDKVNKVDDTVNKVDDKVGKVDDKVGRVDDKVSRVGDTVDKVDNKVTMLIDGAQNAFL